MLVLEYGIEISVHANPIGKHLLLVVEKSIGAEVICKINAFVNGGGPAANDSVFGAPHVTHCHRALRRTHTARAGTGSNRDVGLQASILGQVSSLVWR